jgi:hypothetical protein
MSAITQEQFIQLVLSGAKAGKTQTQWAEEMASQFNLKADTFKQRYTKLRATYKNAIEKEKAAGDTGSVTRLEAAINLLTLADGRGRQAAENTVESLTAFMG